MIIMDRTLQRAAPAMKGNYLTRSQQFFRKSIRQSGSTSIQLFASTWNIPVIDHSKIFQVCKRKSIVPRKRNISEAQKETYCTICKRS